MPESSSKPIRFKCQCGKQYAVREDLAGKTATCKQCGAKVVIPAVIHSEPLAAQQPTPPPPPQPEAPPAAPVSAPPPQPASQAEQGTKSCPYCGETIMAVAKKCKHCGEFLDPALIRSQSQAQTPAASPPRDDETTLKRIHDWENLSSIFWIIWGIILVVGAFFIWPLIIGASWNCIMGAARRKRLPRILAQNSFIPKVYEPIAPLVVVGIVNLVFGGVIGVAFIVFDFVIRDLVLKNKHLFNIDAVSPQHAVLCGEVSPQSDASTQPPKIPNYLAQSILVTLIGPGLPLGIVAIIYAVRVNGKIRFGDVEGAITCSKKAKKWSTIAAGIAIVFWLFFIIVGAITAMNGSMLKGE